MQPPLIKDLSIENFKAIRKAEFRDFTGVNLILGENGTGKSSVMKLMYAVCMGLKQKFIKHGTFGTMINENYGTKEVLDKLVGVFGPRREGIQELVNSHADTAHIRFQYQNYDDVIGRYNLSFSSKESTFKYENDVVKKRNTIADSQYIFVPPWDALPYFKSIASAVEKELREDFNDSIYDLVKALARSTQKERTHQELVPFKAALEKLQDGGKILFDEGSNDFYFEKDGQRFSISLTAEGTRKIGVLYQLAINREIEPGTVLFIDEPEFGLHPRLVRELIRALVKLSHSGVQIFMSTHSYFVANQLQILARKEPYGIRCFSLMKDATGDIKVHQSNLLSHLPENGIVDEALDMYDEEIGIK